MGKPSGGSSNTSTVTSTQSPPPQVLQAYENVVGGATNAANAPLQQYQGPMIAGFTPAQLSSFNTINNAQGIANPYINAAAQYAASSATPITPTQFSDQQVQQYENPFTRDVIHATEQQFNNQNAQQANQQIGQAVNSGAFGGDREAIAQAELANQQQLAEAPVLANLAQQNYSQALGEFNTQQQVGVGAQEASGWLGSNAGFAMGNLGTAALNDTLTGANAQLQSGALQQQMAQEETNIPYEMFLQQQGYPFQTSNFLAGITEGVGGLEGGTASTTSPGPSTGGQIAGLGIAGLGALGASGAFSGAQGGGGWLTNLFSSGAAAANRGGRVPRGEGGFIPGFGQSDQNEVNKLIALTEQPDVPALGGGAAASAPEGPPRPPAWNALQGLAADSTTKTSSGSGGGSSGGGWGGALQGGAEGAAIGTEIMPGWGTAIGAGVGALVGGLSNRGGRIGRDYGGSLPGVPDVSISFIPGSTPGVGHSTMPNAPQAVNEGNPVTGDLNALQAGINYGKLFKNNNNNSSSPFSPRPAGADNPMSPNYIGPSPTGYGYGSEAATEASVDAYGPAWQDQTYRRGGRLARTDGGGAPAVTAPVATTGGVGGAVDGTAGAQSPLIAGFTQGPRGVSIPVLSTAPPQMAGFAVPTAPIGTNVATTPAPAGQLDINPTFFWSPPNPNLLPHAAVSGTGGQFGAAFGAGAAAGSGGAGGTGSGTGTGSTRTDGQGGNNAGDNGATGLGGPGSNPGDSGVTAGSLGPSPGSNVGNGPGPGGTTPAGDTGPSPGSGAGTGGIGGDAGPDPSSCFTGDTLILMGDGSAKAISAIKVGDTVMAFTGPRTPLALRPVTHTIEHPKKRVLSIDDRVFVTAEHPFMLASGEWRNAGELQVGDILALGDGEHTIASIKAVPGHFDVFNITVDVDHTYIAAGFRVHNKYARGGVIHNRAHRMYGGAGTGGVPGGAGGFQSFGGAGMRLPRDDGGYVAAAGATSSGAPIAGGNPFFQGQFQRFAQLPMEKLQELAVRMPPTTAQGQMIQRALQMKRMNPGAAAGMPGQQQQQSGFAQAPSPYGSPIQPMGQPMGQGFGTMARGGVASFAPGGSVQDKIKQIGSLQDDRMAAARGERAAGSPVTPFSGMPTAPIPLRASGGRTGFGPGGGIDDTELQQELAQEPTPSLRGPVRDPIQYGDPDTIVVRPPADPQQVLSDPTQRPGFQAGARFAGASVTPPAQASPVVPAVTPGFQPPKPADQGMVTTKELPQPPDPTQRFFVRPQQEAAYGPPSERPHAGNLTMTDPSVLPGTGGTDSERHNAGVAVPSPAPDPTKTPSESRPNGQPGFPPPAPWSNPNAKPWKNPDDYPPTSNSDDWPHAHREPPPAYQPLAGFQPAPLHDSSKDPWSSQNPWMALVNMGARMAAGNHRSWMQNAGEGILAGTQTLAAQHKEAAEERYKDAEVQDRAAKLNADLGHWKQEHEDNIWHWGDESANRQDEITRQMHHEDVLAKRYEDAAARGYNQPVAPVTDESGKPVLDPKTHAPLWWWQDRSHPGSAPYQSIYNPDAIAASKEKLGGTEKLANDLVSASKQEHELDPSKPVLTLPEAVDLAHRAGPNADANRVRVERLALDTAKALTNGNPTEADIEKARVKYGLPPASAAAPQQLGTASKGSPGSRDNPIPLAQQTQEMIRNAPSGTYFETPDGVQKKP